MLWSYTIFDEKSGKWNCVYKACLRDKPVQWCITVSITFNVNFSMALRYKELFVAACGVVLAVNLFDLLDSLLQQPYTLSFQACRKSHLLKQKTGPSYLLVSFFSVTNLLACSLTECPATGSRFSSGSNPDHTRRLCSHTEPPGPGAALLGHAHSLQHRWNSLPPKR